MADDSQLLRADRSDQPRLRVLNELRPAADGFSGIPQETRLLHAMFLTNPSLSVTGLLNGHGNPLGRALAIQVRSQKDTMFLRSAAVLDLAEPSELSRFAHRMRRLRRYLTAIDQKAGVLFGTTNKVYPLDMSDFSDFVWRAYFSKSLGIKNYDHITGAEYAGIRPSWGTLQRSGMMPPLRGRYARIDTSGYDVFMSQTPFPARVSPATKMIVRYHDGIPIFYPHTIHNPHQHQFSHYYPLRQNLRDGALLVCNSENSQREVLRMFPGVAQQVRVIPCIVSDQYFPEPPSIERAKDIIAGAIEEDTEPKFLTQSERNAFYQRHIHKAPFRYIMMVSTIEPRKNHARLIAAWNAIRTSAQTDLKLVIVGRPGWHVESVLATMRPFQARGMLFNVSRVSSADLRQLYASAEAVICPSIAEGFDLSGIEAMLSGAAVAASDIPVHREVYGDACTYFSPYSTKEAADAILHIIGEGSADNRKRLIEAGKKQGALYLADRIEPKWQILFQELSQRK